MNKINKGIWASLITPFNEDGSLDLEAARKYLEYISSYEFSGLLLGGSVGEGLLLSSDELRQYIKLAREITSKKIMIGIADFNYERAKEKLKLDYDYVLVTPPIYFKPHKEAINRYLVKIADTAKAPVMLYNNPGRVGVGITAEMYKRLSFHFDIIAVKECDDEVLKAQSKKLEEWTWFSGNDDVLTKSWFMNNPAKGGIVSTLCNICPDLSIRLWQNISQNLPCDIDMQRWDKFVNAAYSIPNPLAVKIMLAKWGIIQPFFRAHFEPLPKFEHADLFLKPII